MYKNFWMMPANYTYNGFGAWFGVFLVPLVIWTLFWKGLALWKAARSGAKGWFIALLILNTLGILDIIYITLFAKKSSRKK